MTVEVWDLFQICLRQTAYTLHKAGFCTEWSKIYILKLADRISIRVRCNACFRLVSVNTAEVVVVAWHSEHALELLRTEVKKV